MTAPFKRLLTRSVQSLESTCKGSNPDGGKTSQPRKTRRTPSIIGTRSKAENCVVPQVPLLTAKALQDNFVQVMRINL